jgi:cyclic beta-1,2-glucan synthetase
VHSLLDRLVLSTAPASPWRTDDIIREELFSSERLEQHAASLAEAQSVTTRRRARTSLNARLHDNARALLRAHRAITSESDQRRPITPAAAWLIDNYHVVEEQIHQIQEDLSPRFYRELPKLANGPFAGYPRVFGIAWACIAHSDSRFEPENLRRFVRAYQHVEPLTIGELWALAITLRIVLVENLRRAADRIVGSRIARQQADQVADQLLGSNGATADPEALLNHPAARAFSATFVVQIIKRLRDQDPRVVPALSWLESQLVAQGTSSEQMVRDEHQRQGASNITVRNIITSMRLISDSNWSELFEEMSLVDATLRSGSDFDAMDFATRNLYRSAIEQLARGCKHSELQIARALIVATRTNSSNSPRTRDPGYHMLGGGRAAFELAIGYRLPWRYWLGGGNRATGPVGYISLIFMVSALVLATPLWLLAAGVGGWQLLLLALAGSIPAIDAAVALTNRAAMREFGATLLPGMALREGIPAQLRTMVVVPMLLTSVETIRTQLQRLEVHYLTAPPGEVYFALLSDWTDAATESDSGDRALLDIAAAGIARLNRMHPAGDAGARFHLFHRRRTWSAGQQQWMGWERKRGKLHELNALLRGKPDTTFIAVDERAPRVPPAVRYVVTLDADTRLPRETLRRLIGKLAHPLNQPRLDATTQRVLEGYAILQPRVTPSLPIGREGSLFQRVFSSTRGIDPYAAAASDVYQDLFGEGSFAGKGIYDVDAFEAALAGCVPQDSLLSHDLFEGTLARAGLVSDVEVVEEFPARYDVAAARSHRWARGDWQLLPWLLGYGKGSRNALPLLGAWKMLDNLRRTLSAPAAVLALFAGWVLPLPAAAIWTAFIVLTVAVPVLLPTLSVVLPQRRGVDLRSHVAALGTDLRLALLQLALLITLLAHQAWLMLDAIARTLFRLGISHRNLLEWLTTAQAQLSERLGLAGTYRRMLASVGIAVLAVLVATQAEARARWLVLPFAVLWLAAPAIARWISITPPVAGRIAVCAADQRALRHIARRTWRFFETFVTATDHMLPPDNFQEDPRPVVAHRTSPTNLGLYLLCVVSARDFGWIGTRAAVERLQSTLATMERLPRYRGHFYNWYDTRELRALEPLYVSSVDSGNLAAHLITLANACHEWQTQGPAAAEVIAGIFDALELTRATLGELPDDRRTAATARQQVAEALDTLSDAVQDPALREEVLLASDLLERLAALAALARILVDAVQALSAEHHAAQNDLSFWAQACLLGIESWQRDNQQTTAEQLALTQRLTAIEAAARTLALGMDFTFLLDPQRRLLAIGYRPDAGTLDPSCYDLLASEARLASFFAIAKNDVPTRHWFRLGRAMTPVSHRPALVSWSGSMFEYLMPSLVMRAADGSLLEHTNRLIVEQQIRYGSARGVPWGISESAYNARDLELTYQYSNFGVPGLGLKRGLRQDLVIAPYATALAAMVKPAAATANLVRLAALGACGRYGFYEALDYTPARVPQGAAVVIVRAFMAHHQGMTVVAIANVLFDGRMRARFHAESSVQATELLLQESPPRAVYIAHPRAEEIATAPLLSDLESPAVRRLSTAHELTPQTHLLSNGRYTVMLTAAGSGYSRWRDLTVTRWRADSTRDDCGSYLFLRDVADGSVWSAGYQPSGVEPDSYAVSFTEDRAELRRRDGAITTELHVVVSPEHDAEVRCLMLTNTGSSARTIDVTSYSELVLTSAAADSAHPAFAKLFVHTEYLASHGALLATRRPRSADEPQMWAVHHAIVEGEVLRPVEFETDRAQFLGRGREIRAPHAVMDGRPLSNTVGTVLDPIFALRYRVLVPPNATTHLSFWTAVADSRSSLLDGLDKHRDANASARASTLAWTQAQVQLRHLGVAAAEAHVFQRLAGYALYADAALRPSSTVIQSNQGQRDALWAQGISGDAPIVLLRIEAHEDIEVARQLLRAHEYWRLKQLPVDLVIVNERAASYVQDLQIALETAVRASQSRPPIGNDPARGSVFVLRADLISAATRSVLTAVCCISVHGQGGSLQEQLEARAAAPRARMLTTTQRTSSGTEVRTRATLDTKLEYFNGLGGFADNGREYVTVLEGGQTTPAPWINVIANRQFGFQVAVEGSGYTWAVNSRENQLTQWSNDPVTDRPGEVLYVRDEETGELLTPTAAPLRDAAGSYRVRHGQGYSCFEHTAHGIELELLMYVPLEDSIKICRLTIRNRTPHSRRLTVTAYLEWVLGTRREASAPYVVTEIDTESGAMFARNPWNGPFSSRVAFADLDGRQMQWTADRREFLGRHGTLDWPAALCSSAALSKRTGAGLDPCCALQAPLQLLPNATTEIVFLLGDAASASAARTLLARYRSADLDAVLQQVRAHWDEVLGAVQVATPDRAMDLMLNRWLLYQALACRIWARSAFYQASGAYGFRDQLQDGMALAMTQPAITREHLLRAAGRQFPEGDVQHWWLPPLGQGVRTHISDDRIWLAHAAAQYLDTTADSAIFDEPVPFLEGPKLAAAAHDAYFLPGVAEQCATFYEHCALALDSSLATGEHGLPLMGTGDWNDGMNRVGEHGRGESVWLGWFLYSTLQRFAPIAAARNQSARSAHWLAHAATLRESLERHGWDGAWYRRGYFDDGSPLGSASNPECRIDSIAQSWSVISGAAEPARAEQAMAALDAQLIRRSDHLALLFTPPFEYSTPDPGYVKAYPPGIRENGGQYTHAAAWAVMAFAKLGQADQAAALFALLNPINRASTRAGLQRYKVEPYVVAADVYSVPPHAGRGGWTWYTGSAAWLYRAGIESILGFHLQGDALLLTPCIPADWPRFTIHFKYRTSRYEVSVENPVGQRHGTCQLSLDGTPLPGGETRIFLVDDGAVHRIQMLLG